MSKVFSIMPSKILAPQRSVMVTISSMFVRLLFSDSIFGSSLLVSLFLSGSARISLSLVSQLLFLSVDQWWVEFLIRIRFDLWSVYPEKMPCSFPLLWSETLHVSSWNHRPRAGVHVFIGVLVNMSACVFVYWFLFHVRKLSQHRGKHIEGRCVNSSCSTLPSSKESLCHRTCAQLNAF